MNTEYTYLRVHADIDSTNGGLGDELAFRKAIQDALARSFGLSAAGTYVDVLRMRSGIINAGLTTHSPEPGALERKVDDAVIRVAREDASRVKAALASAPGRLSVVDEAIFLPALLASESSPLN